MVLVSLGSCNKINVISCPPVIIPSEQALHDIESVRDTKPALYDYVDAVGVREEFIANRCK
jgi:hypothetical protein